MNFIYIIFIVCVTFSCANNDRVSKEIKLLRSNPISLPYNASIITNVKEISMVNFVEPDLKLIVYTDSVGCSSCGIKQLHYWGKLIDYAEVYGGRLKYYFIFAPSSNKISDMMQALQNNELNYPILLDTTHEFEKLNPNLPKNMALHTFLLDENNNVILVGNPLHNAQIEQMFYKKVEEKLNND